MTVIRVFTGKIRHDPGCAPTAMRKNEVHEALWLDENGLAGDEQVDPEHHGGPDRALHQYPPEHYETWRQRFPAHAAHFRPAAFGENLSVPGWTEENVHIGDVFSWGEARLQVSQPRSPCFKLNEQSGIVDLALRVQETAHCGWLLRVLKPGQAGPQSPFARERTGSAITVREAMRIVFGDLASDDGYRRLLALDALAASWRRMLQQRLDSGRVESWDRRLYGIASA